ncbi:UNVERIFIED_CONTAM: hypothetical protein HDU68_005740, partial [Siphonaria sp. JEL0065]
MSLVVGISIVIAMNALSSFGVNLQAVALRRAEDPQRFRLNNATTPENNDEDDPLLSTTSMTPPGLQLRVPDWLEPWLWHIGFVCYIIPQLFGSILALNFISPILLAPLGSSGLVFNVFFSSILVGTKVGPLDWVATALIILGGTIVSLFGNVDVEIQESTNDGENDVESQTTALQTCSAAFDNHVGFLYSSVGGISAAMTLTIVKCGLNLVASSLDEYGNASILSLIVSESDVLMYVFLILSLVASVLLQLITLNKAIVFISPLIAIPVFYTFFTSLSVSNTLVIVFSIPGLELPDGIAFTIQMAIAGVSVIVGGVWVLSYSSVSSGSSTT